MKFPEDLFNTKLFNVVLPVPFNSWSFKPFMVTLPLLEFKIPLLLMSPDMLISPEILVLDSLLINRDSILEEIVRLDDALTHSPDSLFD